MQALRFKHILIFHHLHIGKQIFTEALRSKQISAISNNHPLCLFYLQLFYIVKKPFKSQPFLKNAS